tara:strand:- start:2084 stop:2215 length:132 start_codon:yes stop_codon:yes gene_type:complete
MKKRKKIKKTIKALGFAAVMITYTYLSFAAISLGSCRRNNEVK